MAVIFSSWQGLRLISIVIGLSLFFKVYPYPRYNNLWTSCILQILMWWKEIGLDIIYRMMHAFNFWQKYFIVHFWKHEEIPFAVALFWQPYHFTLLRWFCTKENAFFVWNNFSVKMQNIWNMILKRRELGKHGKCNMIFEVRKNS